MAGLPLHMAIGARYRPGGFASPLLCPTAFDAHGVHDLLSGQCPFCFQPHDRARLPGEEVMTGAAIRDDALVPMMGERYATAPAAVQDHLFGPFIFDIRTHGGRTRNDTNEEQKNAFFHYFSLDFAVSTIFAGQGQVFAPVVPGQSHSQSRFAWSFTGEPDRQGAALPETHYP
jgi:hypothetical protein